MKSGVARVVVVLLGAVLAGGVSTVGAQTPAGDCRVIDDFSNAKVGEFPTNWKVREDAGKEVYAVKEEDGKRFLHAHAKNLGLQAAREYEWDLKQYPVLAWSWRAVEFPRGANEKDGPNDSAVAVYMLGPYSRVLGFKSVKYIWSENVPEGTRLSSSRGRTQVRVLDRGTDRRGQWVEHRGNVRDDYLKYFDEKDVPKAAGIAVLTDSDDTKSSAQGDYASFRVCKE